MPLSSNASETAGSTRIAYLDGHRGLAIVLVILFHAYVRWPQVVPYGDKFADFPLFSLGHFGVQLFFLISGFVIAMTLEKCRSSSEFLFKRWLRLFPAMLICSAIIFATAAIFPERPAGTPSLRDLLPGLTFIHPHWWASVLGTPQGALEGAFWSLYVEMQFYLVIGLVYFRLGIARSIGLVFALFLIHTSLWLAYRHSPPGENLVLLEMLDSFGFTHFGWFAAGACLHRYWTSAAKLWLAAAVVAILASAAVAADFHWKPGIAITLIALFFAASLQSKLLQNALRNRVLVFFGFVSYPLYLLHENMMVALIVKLGKLSMIPAIFLPLIPIAVVTAIAWVVARYLEGGVRSAIKRVAVRSVPA